MRFWWAECVSSVWRTLGREQFKSLHTFYAGYPVFVLLPTWSIPWTPFSQNSWRNIKYQGSQVSWRTVTNLLFYLQPRRKLTLTLTLICILVNYTCTFVYVLLIIIFKITRDFLMKYPVYNNLLNLWISRKYQHMYMYTLLNL